MGKRKSKKKPGVSHRDYVAQVFRGINMESDGKMPSVRQKPQPDNPTFEERKQAKRDTEARRKYDMRRQNIKMVKNAMAKKRVLNFRMADFQRERERQKVPLKEGGPFRGLAGKIMDIKESDGPLVLVDLDDVVVFWYFPGYIGTGLQSLLLEKLAALVKAYPPSRDDEKGDRRSKPDLDATESEDNTRNTRSGLSRTSIQQDTVVDESRYPERSEEECSTVGGVETEAVDRSEAYVETEGSVAWEGDQSAGDVEVPGERFGVDEKVLQDVLDKINRPPSSYHFSPGWFQTGQEKRLPIEMSLQFHEALEDRCCRETIEFLEAKRLYDWQIAHLTNIIHRSLGRSMAQVKAAMMKVRGPTRVALENGWTSNFPCFAVGINRQTKIHRDTKGFRAGMDVIGVLGNFQGGKLRLQDLNVEFEWRPGCLGAFDGYDLAHEVLLWEGGHRITLISFCRSSTWRGLNIDQQLSRPTLDEVRQELHAAQEARGQGVQAGVQKRANEGTGGGRKIKTKR